MPFDIPVSNASFAGLALAALVMVSTPGPNMMYLVSRSIGQGRRAGLVSLAGTFTGFLVYMLMANLGMAVVFVAVPALYIGFKAAGACYLAHLAWKALKPGGAGVFEVSEVKPETSWHLFRMGLVTTLLNPKAAIIYLTLIPQFVDPARGHTLAQSLALSVEQVTISTGVNALIILAAGGIASFLAASRSRMAWQRRITGTMLGGVTLMLVREVPRHASA